MSGDGHEETLAADRRVLVIAAVATVAFVAIGAVSASVFATSACDVLDPQPRDAAVLADDADDAGVDLVDDLAVFRHVWGARETVVEMADVTGLATGGEAIVVRGATTAVVDDAGVRAVAFGDTSAVVGSGDTVFALALTNVVSGQVDALRALPTTLTPLACVDTAVVGSPLAFHLDARDGELLLARIEEDAAEPMLELRAAAGVVWEAPITVPMAPPGVLAERLSAFIGDDLVVVARRSAPGEASPALAAFDRLTGSERWTVDVAAVGIDDTQRIDVRALDGGLVVLDVRADTDGRAPATLIALDASDGQLVWRHVVEGDLQDVHVTGEGVVFAVSRDDALDIVTVDASGDMRTDVRVPGASTAVFRADGATWIAATDRGLLAADGTLTTTRHALLDVAITPARAAVAVETDRGPVVAVYRRS